MWGLRGALPRHGLCGRAIPTCVGTTGRACRRGARTSGHPHVRGDYSTMTPRVPGSPGHPHVRGDYFGRHGWHPHLHGPSPSAWGLPHHPQVPHPGPRAIPTCVGTTSSSSGTGTRWPGHPHVRGDYGTSYSTTVKAYRAIPTCVGTTGRCWRRTPAGPGHPHVRGDYSRASHPRYRPTGHPHVRGDYVVLAQPTDDVAGPSPRAWGLHLTRTAKMPVYPPLCVFSGEVSGRGFQVPPRRGKG